MKLLVLTQKIDQDDPVLGFFHGWMEELSKEVKELSIICLEKGRFELPQNVKVYSLGKEAGRSRIKYVKNFFNLILGLHREYEAVLVHMNQEYALLGGPIWRIMGKRVYLWRNHPKGSFLTRIAVALSTKVFCTSKFSYTARFKKTKLMPAGIDTSKFKIEIPNNKFTERKNKVLFLGRISPIKRPDLLIEAMGMLKDESGDLVCDIYGDPLPKDKVYYESLKKRAVELGIEGSVNFWGSVPNHEAPAIYNNHEIFVNLTPSGSLDKAMLEAAACGSIVLTSNRSLAGEIDEDMIIEDSPETVAEGLRSWLKKSGGEADKASERLREYVVKTHGLDILIKRICEEIKN